MKKPKYALSVKSFKKKEGSRGIVVTATSKVNSPDREKNISRLDVYVNGRPHKSIDAKDGSIRPTNMTLPKNRNRKPELLLEARDGANKLVAIYRRRL